MAQALQIAQPGTALALRDQAQEGEVGLNRLLRVGLIAVAVLVLGFGGLMAVLPMAGAVIAPGEVTVESHVKQIAHPFGGVAQDILVSEGDRVKAGDVLIRLDSRVSGANSDLTGLSVDQLMARAARLRAERDGLARIPFPAELTRRAGEADIAALMRAEARNFALRRQARADQANELRRRIDEQNAEIAGLDGQASAYAKQETLIREELTQTRELYKDRYTTLDRLNALERAAAGVEANRTNASSGIGASRARIAQLGAQLATLGSGAQSQAATELMDVEAQIADTKRQQVAADDSFDRSAIRAPQAGIVDKLAIRTIGGVIPPGETIIEIVPDSDRLVVKATVGLTDIDSVQVGQKAFLRFSALNLQTTPELHGKVTRVAADRTVDPNSGAAYYSATIEVTDAEFRKLGKVPLKVGMPVETFIQTGTRTMLSYIVRPLRDQLYRAFREN